MDLILKGHSAPKMAESTRILKRLMECTMRKLISIDRLSLLLALCLVLSLSYCTNDDIVVPDEDLITGWGSLRDKDLAPQDSLYAYDVSEAKEISQITTTGDFVFVVNPPEMIIEGNPPETTFREVNEIYQVPKSIYKMIIDMGETHLGSVTEAPESGYVFNVFVHVGHVYCIKTQEGHFAKFRPSVIDTVDKRIEFDWVYQSSGRRKF
jgi:hypothetical protein